MLIKRHRRRLASGEERVYTGAVSEDGSRRQPLSILPGASEPILYRQREFRRIVAALQANSSLLVVGEAGCGKTFLGSAVVEELEEMDFKVAVTKPGTVKQTLLSIALQLGVDTESIEGKALSSMGLMKEIADWLKENTAFLICDNAHRFPVSLRCWLDQLHSLGQPLASLKGKGQRAKGKSVIPFAFFLLPFAFPEGVASLYLLGGILTVAVGVIRIMIYSLPRKGGRLGK